MKELKEQRSWEKYQKSAVKEVELAWTCSEKSDGEYVGKRVIVIEVPGKRRRGRPKKR